MDNSTAIAVGAMTLLALANPALIGLRVYARSGGSDLIIDRETIRVRTLGEHRWVIEVVEQAVNQCRRN